MSKYQKFLDEMVENAYCMNCERYGKCEDKTCCEYLAPRELQILINRSEDKSDDWFVKRNVELIQENKNYKLLEEELGCPLEVVFEATTNGIIDFEGKEHTVVFGGYYLFVVENDELICGISLKNYQKTWWIKGEKNE